jgi:hypothetical protein
MLNALGLLKFTIQHKSNLLKGIKMMQIEEIFFSLIERTQLTLFNHQTVFSVVLFEADR